MGVTRAVLMEARKRVSGTDVWWGHVGTLRTLHGIVVEEIALEPSQVTSIAEWDAPVAGSQNCLCLRDVRHEVGSSKAVRTTRRRSVQRSY
jgi:hypothetical protein